MPRPPKPVDEPEAQAEARRRIAKWKQARDLNAQLRLNDLKLGTLPPELFELPRLRNLNLSGNRLTSLPREIGRLRALRGLFLSRNQLTTLPSEIGQLSAMRVLTLDDNHLTTLPPEIGQLSAMRGLGGAGNQFTTLPPEIGQLTALELLYLDRNPLTTLPPEIGQLTALEQLVLEGNQLTTLPPELCQLTTLTHLYLSSNQLTTLPPEIGQLTSLTHLFLHANPALGLPPDVLGPDWGETLLGGKNAPPKPPREILEYYFAARDGRALREVKLILVGRGEVGKSSMADALRGGKFMQNRPQTDGISITPWPVKLRDGAAKVLLWDFGGQEIMHGTHQFFLTHRSLYVVMVDGRHDRAKQDAEYWLKLVRAFGGDSTVLVVMNRQKAHPFDMDRQYLAEKYGVKLEHFFRTDCERARDIPPLRKAVLAEAERMLAVEERFPAKCWQVKTRLEEMQKHGEDYLSDEAYADICTKHGVAEPEEQQKLLRRLADLGTVVSFPDEQKLSELTVLNPEWATDGIYRVVTNEELREEKHGQLKPAALRKLLPVKRWPKPKHVRYLLDLMEKFQLCFPVDGGDTVLVPELLPDKTPLLPDWDAARCVVFLYQYPVLPHGVLPRFITRTHTLAGGERWRSGVVLAKDGAEALIKADYDANLISVWVRGDYASARRALLTVVRDHFDHIHARIKDLNPAEQVAVPGHPEVTVPYRDLLLDERDRVKTVRVTIAGQRAEREIADLLNGVETLAERKKKQARLETEGRMERMGLMSIDKSIHIHGDVRDSQVGQTLRDCTNMIQHMPAGKPKELLEKLLADLEPVREEMKGKDAKVLDGHLAKLTEEVQKPAPDRGALSLTAKGVVEAAETVGKIAKPVVATVGTLLKLFGA
ncbi:MAG: leucine-rich repeat domain-containing protein [Chthoniobacter sp.]|nr:leucine-rich repeat domain-containing protein [Chthoniobacter sp.]